MELTEELEKEILQLLTETNNNMRTIYTIKNKYNLGLEGANNLVRKVKDKHNFIFK